MAVQTPAHRKRLDLLDADHLVDPAMARRASDASRQMSAMIEIDEIGELVDVNPGNGLVLGEALANRQNLGAIGSHLGVAVHAHLRGGHGSKGRALHRGMAIATIEPEVSSVKLMTVLDRLDGTVAHRQMAVGAVVGEGRPSEPAARQENAESYGDDPVAPTRK